ncbi:MAG: hypothetical protein KGK07_14720 [Chloroflexota bacterium]|nr:hypothetical protein [Chloroflexota bacterium]
MTVESYCKWYALQVVMPDGAIAEYDFGQLEPHAENYVSDHCPSPVAVVRWARAMGFEVHGESLEMILGRWLLESGESKPKELLEALDEALDEGV